MHEHDVVLFIIYIIIHKVYNCYASPIPYAIPRADVSGHNACIPERQHGFIHLWSAKRSDTRRTIDATNAHCKCS